jgi:hypothetical protein
MHFLLADETNKNQGDFFIYGALYFDLDLIDTIDKAIRKIRNMYGFGKGDYLKWSHNNSPSEVDKENHTKAKTDVIKLAKKANATFVPVIVNHRLASNVSERKQFRWAINDVLGRFQYFLKEEEDDTGICAIDPIPDSAGAKVLENVFHYGLQFPDRRDDIELTRIRMISTVYANSSHAASMMDIVLGAFGYCIRHPDKSVSEEMFADLASLTYRFSESDGFDYQYGVLFRPEDIKAPTYQKRYDQLQSDMENLLDRSLAR